MKLASLIALSHLALAALNSTSATPAGSIDEFQQHLNGCKTLSKRLLQSEAFNNPKIKEKEKTKFKNFFNNIPLVYSKTNQNIIDLLQASAIDTHHTEGNTPPTLVIKICKEDIEKMNRSNTLETGPLATSKFGTAHIPGA